MQVLARFNLPAQVPAKSDQQDDDGRRRNPGVKSNQPAFSIAGRTDGRPFRGSPPAPAARAISPATIRASGPGNNSRISCLSASPARQSGQPSRWFLSSQDLKPATGISRHPRSTRRHLSLLFISTLHHSFQFLSGLKQMHPDSAWRTAHEAGYFFRVIPFPGPEERQVLSAGLKRLSSLSPTVSCSRFLKDPRPPRNNWPPPG